jgi:predicted PurR-regulated permease PerM
MAGERTIKIKIDGSADGLKRAAKDAEKAVENMNKGILGKVKDLAGKIPEMLSGIIDSLPPMGKPLAIAIGGGVAAALAPILAAAISSALLLALGGGVLAAGIALVAKNPKVKSAFDKLKDSMFDKDTSEIEKKIEAAQERFVKAQALGQKKGMESAKYDIEKAKKELNAALTFNTANRSLRDLFKPFVDPLVRAAATLTKTFNGLKPTIDRIAKTLAPVIDKLAPAFGDFLTRMMPGIEKAVKASVPLFETLAENLPKIGDAISIFFDEISKNGDDANMFFGDLLDIIINIIAGLGKAIGTLTSWYSNIIDFLTKAKIGYAQFKVDVIKMLGQILDAAVKSLSWIPGIGPKLQAAQKEFREFQQQANAELKKIKDKEVSITISTNLGTIAGQIANLGAQIANAGLRKRAAGGPVIAGRSYMVGEKGPEILTMSGSNGNITPSHNSGSGGDTYVAQIVVNGVVREEVQLEFKKQNRKTRAAVLARG